MFALVLREDRMSLKGYFCRACEFLSPSAPVTGAWNVSKCLNKQLDVHRITASSFPRTCRKDSFVGYSVLLILLASATRRIYHQYNCEYILLILMIYLISLRTGGFCALI